MELHPDLRSVSDADLDGLFRQLTEREKEISRERRLLHKYLHVLGIERSVQTTGVPWMAGSRSWRPGRMSCPTSAASYRDAWTSCGR